MQELTKEQKNRIDAAKEAIDVICDNYKVALVPSMVIMQGNIVSHQVGILPQQEESRIVQPSMRKEVVKDIVNNPGGKNGA